MREYSFTEARQHFASILNQAKKEGVVCVKKKNGEVFYIRPAISTKSPLDIEGVDLNVTTDEIVDIIRSGRDRSYS
ncbi:MAG: type II toxin-antitoxin system prevent-host-death family antitoxin [Candidatus Thiodiazotropha sp.]